MTPSTDFDSINFDFNYFVDDTFDRINKKRPNGNEWTCRTSSRGFLSDHS